MPSTEGVKSSFLALVLGGALRARPPAGLGGRAGRFTSGAGEGSGDEGSLVDSLPERSILAQVFTFHSVMAVLALNVRCHDRDADWLKAT
jgi:hypothetical protein